MNTKECQLIYLQGRTVREKHSNLQGNNRFRQEQSQTIYLLDYLLIVKSLHILERASGHHLNRVFKLGIANSEIT